MTLIPTPQHHQEPFPFFQCADAVLEAHCDQLEALFDGEKPWQRREGGFYNCFLRDASAEVPQTLCDELRGRMQGLITLPLLPTVQVTAQRMEPGQHIGAHSDRPLVGYEIARLVLHLNHDWQPEAGGVLEILDEESAVRHRLCPYYNHGFGFVLHPSSHHQVTKVTRTRRSVVFNFWHAANSPDLATAVADLFTGMHFSELPGAFHEGVVQLESQLDEETSFRANLTAWALHRWGYGAPLAIDGFRASAGQAHTNHPALHLARWVARMHHGDFDLEAWQQLRHQLADETPPPPLETLWHLCLPTV